MTDAHDIHDRAVRISLIALAVAEHMDLSPKQAANLAGDLASRDAMERNGGPGNLAKLAREQVAAGTSTSEAVANILTELPGANPDSVAATLRRARRAADRTA